MRRVRAKWLATSDAASRPGFTALLLAPARPQARTLQAAAPLQASSRPRRSSAAAAAAPSPAAVAAAPPPAAARQRFTAGSELRGATAAATPTAAAGRPASAARRSSRGWLRPTQASLPASASPMPAPGGASTSGTRSSSAGGPRSSASDRQPTAPRTARASADISAASMWPATLRFIGAGVLRGNPVALLRAPAQPLPPPPPRAPRQQRGRLPPVRRGARDAAAAARAHALLQLCSEGTKQCKQPPPRARELRTRGAVARRRAARQVGRRVHSRPRRVAAGSCRILRQKAQRQQRLEGHRLGAARARRAGRPAAAGGLVPAERRERARVNVCADA
jgi:hypothetical protein